MEGLTIDSDNGCIIFPVTEPFGSHLRESLGDNAAAERFLFQELYDSTRTIARQHPEKNKFRLTGEYRGSSGTEINLNAYNVPPGSVKVMAGGVPLSEGADYMVDYLSGTVRIINRSILDAGTPIQVTLEDRAVTRRQRKTLAGIDLQYDLSKNLTLGATLMHYREKPLVVNGVRRRVGTKYAVGCEHGLPQGVDRADQPAEQAPLRGSDPAVGADYPPGVRADDTGLP